MYKQIRGVQKRREFAGSDQGCGITLLQQGKKSKKPSQRGKGLSRGNALKRGNPLKGWHLGEERGKSSRLLVLPSRTLKRGSKKKGSRGSMSGRGLWEGHTL